MYEGLSNFLSQKNGFDWNNFGAQGGSVNNTGGLVNAQGNVVGQMNWDSNTGTWDSSKVNNPNATAVNQSSGGLASIGAIGSAAQGLAGLANAYLGYKNYQLAKDQFGYEKALGNANLYNQGTLVNNQLDKSAAVGNALAGGTMTEAQRQASLADAASRHVKTTI